jgi:hypothetical protein
MLHVIQDFFFGVSKHVFFFNLGLHAEHQKWPADWLNGSDIQVVYLPIWIKMNDMGLD